MKRALLLTPLILAAAPAPLNCEADSACICLSTQTHREIVESAVYIVEGRVIAHYIVKGEWEISGRIHPFEGFDHAIMEVQTVWKGPRRRTLVLYDVNRAPDSCDTSLLTGRTYLVLLHATGDSVAVDACTRMYEPGEGEAIRTILGVGKQISESHN